MMTTLYRCFFTSAWTQCTFCTSVRSFFRSFLISRWLHYESTSAITYHSTVAELQKRLALLPASVEKPGLCSHHWKDKGPATVLIFFCLELDSIEQLTKDELHQILQELQSWLCHHNKVTKRELLSLIGKQTFTVTAVPTGHLYLRRMITT